MVGSLRPALHDQASEWRKIPRVAGNQDQLVDQGEGRDLAIHEGRRRASLLQTRALGRVPFCCRLVVRSLTALVLARSLQIWECRGR